MHVLWSSVVICGVQDLCVLGEETLFNSCCVFGQYLLASCTIKLKKRSSSPGTYCQVTQW